MSAHQMLITNSRSKHVFSFATAPGSGDGYYYSPEGCSSSIYGYISGSLGSLTSGSTFRGLTITEFAYYRDWNAQNDSQNSDPYEWYCQPVTDESRLIISGATDQYFFKRIIIGSEPGTSYYILPGDATFSSGTWTWAGGVIPDGTVYFEY